MRHPFLRSYSDVFIGLNSRGKTTLMLLFIFSLLLGQIRAQEVLGAQVLEGFWEVQWLEKGAAPCPVGWWSPEDAHWLDEIPWVVYEQPFSVDWAAAEVLVSDETWASVPEEELTERQKQLLVLSTYRSPWRLGGISLQHIAQFQTPLLRYNASTQEFERLIRVDWVIGQRALPRELRARSRSWPESSPLAEGTFYRLSIAKDGVYKIDRNWMVSAGIDPSNIDPRSVRMYGNGGRMLPMENDVDRPLGLLPCALRFDGESDGSWDQGDALFFYGSGPHHWSHASGEWEHHRHAYSDSAWYFLQVDADVLDSASRIHPATTLMESDTIMDGHVLRAFHELELESPNRSGREWFGESFANAPNRTVTFATPFALDEEATISYQIAVQSMGLASTMHAAAGTANLSVSPSYTSGSSTSNVANLGSGTFEGHAVVGAGAGARIDVNFSFDPAVNGALAWLDYVRIEQPCSLRMSGSQLAFHGANQGSGNVTYLVGDASGVESVWDVTDVRQPRSMNLDWQTQANSVQWIADADTLRHFAVFQGFNFLIPDYQGPVTPVDLHAVGSVDLVVITQPDYLAASQRLAALHADEGLSVLVTTQKTVFDEFSSGNPDPTAMKMLMMMLRDRALLDGSSPPRYLQLMGDGTFANRAQLLQSPNIITYQSENSVSPTSSYVSDDYFGFLELEYGEGIGDKMAIGVGRLPCSTALEADELVDKVEAYMLGFDAFSVSDECLDSFASNSGAWRNTICLIADDMDGNGGPTETVHMVNSDEHATTIQENYNAFDINKIYLDAYPQLSTPGGERYPAVETAIDGQVRAGALIMNYIGHGGERGWSHERVLNTTTIQEWDNFYNMPLFMTATCELARFDDPEVESAGEMMVMNPNGGAIAMLTTTRVVFSGSNQQLNRAFYDIALEDSPEMPLRLGDIARVTKNDPQVSNSSNKRNFTLLGDAALRLSYPSFEVFITEIPDTIRALDVVTVSGYVGLPSGDSLLDFEGLVYAKVFDKSSQITTLNNDNGPNPHTFELFRNVLHNGLASVEGGRFEFEFVVPRDIDFTMASGRISCYAVSENTDAHGSSEAFTIGGVSDDFIADSTPPEVHLFLNDTLFQNGGITHANPRLIAQIFDAGGINAAGVGIGHDIKVTLDGASDQSLVLNNAYTADLNTYVSGTVVHAFSDLSDGEHQLEMVVWDVQNNKGKALLDFTVHPDLESAIAHVVAYPNPTQDRVSFNFEHNQACQNGLLTLEVFDGGGKLVHQATTAWTTAGFHSATLEWDTRGSAQSNEVQAGVYIFRLTLSTETGGTVQYADQIVVLRP